MQKIEEILSAIGKILKVGAIWLGKKIKAGSIWLWKGIKAFCRKFVHDWKIPLLIGKILYGIVEGIYFGVKEAIASWKIVRRFNTKE